MTDISGLIRSVVNDKEAPWMTMRDELERRAAVLLEAAILAARVHGIAGCTRERIAEQADCSPGLVSHYWGAIGLLHDAVVRAAIDREELAIIARAMAEGHPAALGASETLRKRAALSIVQG